MKVASRFGTTVQQVTLRDPIFTEQEPLLWVARGEVLVHTGDEGQSPQEQPSEISPHE